MDSGFIGFLHTAPSNVEVYVRAFFKPGVKAEVEGRHRVRADFLERVRRAGAIDENLACDVAEAMQTFEDEGARVVVCTCSSVGAAAERAPPRRGAAFLRTDRPMAEQALAAAPQGRLLVCATFASALEPARTVISDAARAANRDINPRLIIIDHAEDDWLARDYDGYRARIAAAVRDSVGDAEAVVLAQASMAQAAADLTDLSAAIVTSPGAGVARAIELFRARRGW